MTHKELQRALRQLGEYQLSQISQTAMRSLAPNQELADIEPKSCPCCGNQNAQFIRKGFLRGKQCFRCKSCGRKFTYDSKQLASNSQQPVESWLVVLENTLSLQPLNATAEKIGVCHSAAFHMRHTLPVYMEEAMAVSVPLEIVIEVVDKYKRKIPQKGIRSQTTERMPALHS